MVRRRIERDQKHAKVPSGRFNRNFGIISRSDGVLEGGNSK